MTKTPCNDAWKIIGTYVLTDKCSRLFEEAVKEQPRPRAWDKKEKYMYYFNPLYVDDEYGTLSFGCNNEVGHSFYKYIDEYEISWSTGFYDKSKRAIFSGDIVKCAQTEGASEPEVFEVRIPVFYKLCQFICSPDEMEIIGNIWENPEVRTQVTLLSG